ncbi:hypothetical protein KC678_03895, partial [Candidatus Dojkabacteria bacterium]|nr:hypothetical protein [Candidatus Dojkabacteria bacterium]
DQIEVNESNSIINFLINVTNGFVAPFTDIIPPSYNFPLVLDAGFAVLIYITWGTVLVLFISAFLQESKKEIVKDSTDAVFKFVESLLVLRLIFDFFSLNLETPFVNMITEGTRWAEGLIESSFLGDRMNISVLLMLFILVIFDLITERIIDMIVSNGDKSE